MKYGPIITVHVGRVSTWWKWRRPKVELRFVLHAWPSQAETPTSYVLGEGDKVTLLGEHESVGRAP